MGKINDKMRKSRENITNDIEPISQEVIHEHEWHFATESSKWNKFGDYVGIYSKFVCPCGGAKKVLQFKVEE